MTDELVLHKALERASRAESLMRDEMLQESFDGMIAAYTKAWRNSTDLDERDRCWHQIRAIDEVRMRLGHIISGGKVAQAELNQMAAQSGKQD